MTTDGTHGSPSATGGAPGGPGKWLLSWVVSRKIAVILLSFLIALLVFSVFLPSRITLGDEKWAELAVSRPVLFSVARHFSTPEMVRGPLFAVTALFLFLSTLLCTGTRIAGRLRHGREEAAVMPFSAMAESVAEARPDAEAVRRLFLKRRWQERADSPLCFEKGYGPGFWGSIVFHVGLLFCFAAAPVSMVNSFHGSIVLTEGIVVPLRQLATSSAERPDLLPDASVALEGLRAGYYRGEYDLSFSGKLVALRDGNRQTLGFAVNQPVELEGFQFSLQEFGFAPRLIASNEGRAFFDYYLNLRHAGSGDWFQLGNGQAVILEFFPDFVAEGDSFSSRSREVRNPKLLVVVKDHGRTAGRLLLSPGEMGTAAGTTFSFPDYRHWAGLSISRDKGIVSVIMGFILCVGGLSLRFASNPRVAKVLLAEEGDAASVRIVASGKYYPAFLERETAALAAACAKRTVT